MTNTTVDDLAAPLAPGTKAPEFELPLTPDRTVSLAEFRGQPASACLPTGNGRRKALSSTTSGMARDTAKPQQGFWGALPWRFSATRSQRTV